MPRSLLDSLSVLERGVVKALVLDGARVSCNEQTLILAYPAFCLDPGGSFYKWYERLPNGQWQQVLCVEAGDCTLCSVTPFDLDA